jgi:hypothetical protein
MLGSSRPQKRLEPPEWPMHSIRVVALHNHIKHQRRNHEKVPIVMSTNAWEALRCVSCHPVYVVWLPNLFIGPHHVEVQHVLVVWALSMLMCRQWARGEWLSSLSLVAKSMPPKMLVVDQGRPDHQRRWWSGWTQPPKMLAATLGYLFVKKYLQARPCPILWRHEYIFAKSLKHGIFFIFKIHIFLKFCWEKNAEDDLILTHHPLCPHAALLQAPSWPFCVVRLWKWW